LFSESHVRTENLNVVIAVGKEGVFVDDVAEADVLADGVDKLRHLGSVVYQKSLLGLSDDELNCPQLVLPLEEVLK